MQYKLFDNKYYSSPIYQILTNRGIPENDIEEWINAGWPQINSPWLFGEEKVKYAIELMNQSFLNNKDLYVVVDSDCDGYTSAAIIMNYLYKIYPERINSFHYILHTGKQHGLEDTVNQIPNNCLVILPDSSTNDINEIKILLENNCSVVILD